MDTRSRGFHAATVHCRASPLPGTTPGLVGPPGLLHEIFEQQAARTPEAIALVFGRETVAYGDLDRRANQQAYFLKKQGIGPGQTVGLLLPRSPELYIGLLAVLKAGAAYVPLDPGYPTERVGFILEDCAASLLLTFGDLGSQARSFRGKTILLEKQPRDLEACPGEGSLLAQRAPAPADLCYVIYTSGTTGRPKGVQIEHRSAVHLVEAERELFQVSPRDRVFQGFSIAFDASVEEIWLAFATGAALVVGTEAMLRSGPDLSRHLAEAGVTVLSCVPTLLSMMEDAVPGLRLLILGGEVCPPELIKRWWRPQRRVVNTYGPTEATVIATWADCRPDQPVTIGRPLPGYLAFILNENLGLAAPGQAGELVLGGPGLARGYLGQPELTAEKFIVSTLNGGPAQRLYRTGDCARWTENGELEYLGRLDTQVKIRGFRVELSEIESVLLESQEVRAAAVVLRTNHAGIAQLVAYVVPRLSAVVDQQALRAGLKARLPAYMVPALIEAVPALPTLPSGKVDRRALPAPGTPSRPRIDGPEGAAAPLQARIVSAWSEWFAPAHVCPQDDFFLDLGGHSLLAARMVSALRRMPEFDSLSMADVYRFPTAAGLAEALERRSRARTQSADPPRGRPSGRPGAENSGEASDPPQSRGDETAFGREPASTGQVPGRAIPFWRHFWCGAAQFVSLGFILSFFALQWLAPYLTYTVLVEEEYDFIPSVLCAFASLVLLYPLMLALAIALKWLVIGRYRPGSYPLWGWYYFRFWLVTSVEGTVPVSYLAGTPLLNIYLRLMGARIGKNVFLQSDNFAMYDLLSIGDDSSINADATLLGYSVSGGFLHIGPVSVGERCFVGARAILGENSSLGNDSALEDLSLLPAGQTIAPHETWMGSPARPVTVGRTVASEADSPAPVWEDAQPSLAETPHRGRPLAVPPLRRIFFGLLHGLGLLVFPVLVVAALFPGIALMNRLNYLDPYYWYLFLSPLVAVSFLAFLCLEIVGLKWLLLGRIRPGTHRLDSWYYVRKWFVDKTIELSLDIVGPLYASVYLSPWYKMLGARLGKGAEISTASFISPDLLSIGEESFIADNVSLGAPRVRAGCIALDHNRIGRRAFIGNSAMLPPGTVIGDSVLIGCLSAPPAQPADALREDSAWLGSPALLLKQRLKSGSFSEAATFNPPARLRALRAAIEFVRVITPSTGFIILTSLLFSALLLLHDWFSLKRTLLFFPVLYLGCGLSATGFTILLKWVLVGRYRPAEKPLWCTFVWRNELINALHEHLAGPFLIGILTGTPFLAWYLRLLGARIGRRVYLETTDFSEFDLARIGDEVALNADCTIQTHLFEDRVMKMSQVAIGAGCSVGAGSLVLYDTCMEPASALGPLSLLMKGEGLPAGTAWMGIPARLAE